MFKQTRTPGWLVIIEILVQGVIRWWWEDKQGRTLANLSVTVPLKGEPSHLLILTWQKNQ